MKINKNDYINAMNELKVSDDLKRRTIVKVTESEKKNIYMIRKRILSMAAVIVIIFTFVIANNNFKKNNINNNGNNENPGNLASYKLPTVDSYENLKGMLAKSNDYNRRFVDYGIVEEAMPGKSSISSSSTNSASNKIPQSSSSDYSTTNVQVQGVDEADIVKTNGKNIFYCKNGIIYVVDVKTKEVISTLKSNNTFPTEMYLTNDKLIVIATTSASAFNNRYMLAVIQYDISNINDIKEERRVEVEGSLLTSRMVNDNIYIISNKYLYYNMVEDEDNLKPRYKDSAIGYEEKCIEYKDIQYFPDCVVSSYMMVTSFNISDTNKGVNVQTYLGAGDNVYASTENLYVTCEQYEQPVEIFGLELNTYGYSTKIYKFNLKDGQTTYDADAVVPGEVENQFSMDEYNGYFRIATTYSSKATSYKDVNNLYVLNDKLELVGQIENLAPGESIYSVRYMGEKAYVVTFEQVDPLFVIDLSNPKEPKVLGQLKIPGYSDYLHPYDETHIIGFGKDTESNGRIVTTKGFKMALFDVSDVENPKEMYSVNIGDSGTYSELLNNHKALLFSKEKNILAFPITIRENENGSDYYSSITFRGAIIYGLTLENGFEERAKITNETNNKEYNAIDRIIYVDNEIYALSTKTIKVIDMDTMKEVKTIELKVPETKTTSWYDIFNR